MPKYEGILVKQRDNDEALQFFVFAAAAKELLSWADIQRTEDVEGAVQRAKNGPHIKAIRKYMTSSDKNVIPTTVTLAIAPSKYELKVTNAKSSKQVKRATLTVKVPARKSSAKPALVIDGQHRLLAFEGLEDELPIPACVILGADDLERAVHFVVINNKTKKVPTSLVQAIIAELDEHQQAVLLSRLTRVGISLGSFPSALEVLGSSTDSPFKGLLDWDINRDGQRRIKPAALQASMRTIIANLESGSDIDVDESIEILSAMWRGVRASWNLKNTKWTAEDSKDPEKHSKLVDKAGLVAVTEFLVERLNMKLEDDFDVTNLKGVEKFCKSVMATIPSRFWLTEWTEKGLDTSAGRGLIRQSLAAIRRARRSDDPLQEAVLIKSS